MARSHRSTPALQLSPAPQVKNTTEEMVCLKLERCLLEIIEQFGGVDHCSPNTRLRRRAQRDGVKRALAWAALAFLNSEGEDRAGMLVDMVPVHMHLAAKITERREIEELTKLYNLPDTEEEAPAN